MISYWHHHVVRLSTLSVCLSVSNAGCALWLSGSVHMAKSCTSVFLAGKFLWGRWKCEKGKCGTRKCGIKMEENANVSFLRHSPRALVYSRSAKNDLWHNISVNMDQKTVFCATRIWFFLLQCPLRHHIDLKNHFWDNVVVDMCDKAWNTAGVQVGSGVRISKLRKVYWWGLMISLRINCICATENISFQKIWGQNTTFDPQVNFQRGSNPGGHLTGSTGVIWPPDPPVSAPLRMEGGCYFLTGNSWI